MLPLASGGNNGQVRFAIDKKDVYVIAAGRVRRRQRQCSVPPSTEPAGGGAGEPSVRRHVLHSAIPATVAGTLPADRPTPALLNRITSRADASGSVTAGSQFSRVPMKCCRHKRGRPGPLPNRR